MKTVYTFVRYYRKPYPSGNWCPRYAAVYKGKRLVERRLNSTSIRYEGIRGSRAALGYDDACNIVHDYRSKNDFDWERINDLGEVELTVSEFKRYESMFNETIKYHKKAQGK